MKKELRFDYENLKSVNGKYCTVKFLSKYMPQKYQDTLDFIEKQHLSHLPFEQGLFLFMNGFSEPKRCKICPNFLKFESFNYGYRTIYCSQQCKSDDPEMVEKIKATNLKLYGSEYAAGSKIIQDRIKKTNKEKYGVENVFELEEYQKKAKKSMLEKYGVEHVTKNKEIADRATLKFRNRNNIKLCNHCNPVGFGTSYAEKCLFEFIQTLTKEKIITNKRTIISPKELDIYIPSKNLAIEYNGIFWHSDIYNLSNDHLDKTIACEKQNIQLIHIFEDEWINKPKTVKSILSHIFNSKDQKYIKIGLCNVKIISNDISQQFFNINSLDRFIIFNDKKYINFGIFSVENLIGIVAFETSDEKNYILHFAMKNDYKVDIMPIISQFSKSYRTINISVDRRYPTRSFILDNFDLIDTIDPDFYYVDKLGTRDMHRIHKDDLNNRSYRAKIYDCGRRIYQLKK